MRCDLWIVSVVVGVLASLYMAEACNKAVCAPLVSKCMLIKCCECDMSDKKNCSCCRACQVCLASLYTQCCSCVGLCPDPDPNESVHGSSSVENLPDPIPDLFAVLTEEEDPLERWTSFTYSYNLDSLLFKPGTGYTSHLESAVSGAGVEGAENNVDMVGVMGLHNCTTAFSADCMSIAKCKTFCKSMGAAKYRWFHNYGCCQCVDSSCLDYGLNEPHCLRCPLVSGQGSLEDDDFIVDRERHGMDGRKESEDAVKLVPGVVPDSL